MHLDILVFKQKKTKIKFKKHFIFMFIFINNIFLNDNILLFYYFIILLFYYFINLLHKFRFTKNPNANLTIDVNIKYVIIV